MGELIWKMRVAFVVAAYWGGWSEADKADIGERIKAVIDAEDVDALMAWHAWLREVAGLDYLESRCRQIEQKIHQAAAQAGRVAA